ncbi:MAG: phospho-N-acetylmuramoyl-pentapeptide-transferase [Patescibacteria group bacterium]|nr:MAG: phospho-N-acetylmuramoyl-pentapeptide-transferase [Patescibacteria group bacterium]
MIIDVVKIFVPSAIAFFIGIALTPFLTHYLYEYKMWKKEARREGLGGGGTPIFNKLHKEKEVGTPRMGGIIIWASVLLTVFVIWTLSKVFPSELTHKLDFLSRNQTWLPLFTLVSASLVGLVDDILVIYGRGGYIAGGISLKTRVAIVTAIGLSGAWWFFFKLGVASVYMPFVGDIYLGVFFIPFFILVMLALFSGGVIDGIDGLAGGTMAVMFASYAGIAFFQNQIDLAAFSAVIAGGTLAFLWFNIPPARFYMSETGILGLTTTLTVVAFLTDAVLVLPIIAFPLFISSLSVIIQVTSKKLRGGKKVFLVAPIHHHFEALGWPSYKVVMRFWVISVVSAIIGITIVLIG